MPKTYTSYHTNVKLCYSLGIEQQIFPSAFLESIPKTSKQYWKTLSVEHFKGSEYESLSACSLEELKLIADHRTKELRKIYISFLKLYFMLLGLMGEHKWKQLIKTHYRKLVPFIEDIVVVTGQQNFVLKLLKIKASQYREWQKMKKYECKESLIWLCYKRVSRQISMQEIIIMKQLLKDKNYLHWSSGSVWGKAVKDGKISMSMQSWYRYAKLLGLNAKRKKFYKKRKRISVRATKPNEIWHMDVTRFKTSDGAWVYIYTLMDNFSRKILAWNVSKELSGKTRMQSLKRAITEQFIEKENLDLNKSVHLIVDGGSENNNINIHEFIQNCKVGIHKKIALKDVVFSNSLIEGNNRILKQSYLNGKTLNFEELEVCLWSSINEYNQEKPHYIHQIYTPDEIFTKPELKNTKVFFENLNKERIANNKTYSCGKVCP